MPMSAARAGSPPVAARRTFDRLMARLNRLLTNWANYLTLGQVSPACVAIDRRATRRLPQWLGRIVAREGGR